MEQVYRAAEEAETVTGTFLEKAGHVGTAGNHHWHQLPKPELGLVPTHVSASFPKPPASTHRGGCTRSSCQRKVMWRGQVGWGSASRTNFTQRHQGAKGWGPPTAEQGSSQQHGLLPKPARAQVPHTHVSLPPKDLDGEEEETRWLAFTPHPLFSVLLSRCCYADQRSTHCSSSERLSMISYFPGHPRALRWEK